MSLDLISSLVAGGVIGVHIGFFGGIVTNVFGFLQWTFEKKSDGCVDSRHIMTKLSIGIFGFIYSMVKSCFIGTTAGVLIAFIMTRKIIMSQFTIIR